MSQINGLDKKIDTALKNWLMGCNFRPWFYFFHSLRVGSQWFVCVDLGVPCVGLLVPQFSHFQFQMLVWFGLVVLSSKTIGFAKSNGSY